ARRPSRGRGRGGAVLAGEARSAAAGGGVPVVPEARGDRPSRSRRRRLLRVAGSEGLTADLGRDGGRPARSRAAGAGDPRGARLGGPHSHLPASSLPRGQRLLLLGLSRGGRAYRRAGGTAIDLFESVAFPHSLGLLYSTITSYLGFAVNDGEYKVMGLAPYGEPRYLKEMRRLAASGPGGQYRLELRYFDFVRGQKMYSEALADLFGQPPRSRESEITRFHQDVARSLQAV